MSLVCVSILCFNLVLLVISDQEIVDSEEEIVGEELEALGSEQSTALGVIVGVEVVVEHVEAVERLFGLLAEVLDALVHLADHAVLGARLAAHQRRQGDEALRAVLTHQRGQFLDTFNGGHRLSVLEQVLVADVHENDGRLDRVVHLERVSHVLDGATTDELDRAELLGRVEFELLVLVLLLLLVLLTLSLLVGLRLVQHRCVLQVLVQVLELDRADQVADDQEIAVQAHW